MLLAPLSRETWQSDSQRKGVELTQGVNKTHTTYFHANSTLPNYPWSAQLHASNTAKIF
jgi:hypothetical protein